ncbi:MAG TPA: PKD domain-containing protein, partial [Flavisolibacter sp.]|nr:PKD domain-containing protein [Flavisolibacter sp.]
MYLLLAVFAVAQAPTPTFTATPVAGCSPLVVKFTDNSTGNPTAWFWDFGNNATSTLKDPSTTYFLPGTYTVTLKVTNANGSNSQTLTNYITVYDKPEASFTASDSAGCFPLAVQFTDLSKASPGTTNTSWTWDLGDGTQTNEQNPQKTYLYAGNYSLSLKVTNDKGCWSTATKPGYIKVPGGAKADFKYAKVASCNAPFVVNFTNTSRGSGTLSYTWDFGDGTSSTAADPSHAYAQAGIYSVVLITQSSNGCRDTLRQDSLLDLRSSATSFSVPDTVCVNKSITFINTSPDSALTRLWNFGDGTTSTASNPTKSFTATGQYTVTLVQSYSTCTDSATKNIQVVVGPTAGFTAAKRGSCTAPLSVSFQNTSTNAVSYNWDFGDSTTSNAISPTHVYTNLGEYTVTLVAINSSGCSDTLKIPAFVKVARPAISFDGLPAKGCVPYTHTFKAIVDSTDPAVSYLWRFGEGTTSSLPEPSFTYTEQGNYNVSVTVTTASGCTETYEMPAAVKVGTKPEVYFSPQPNEICAFQELHFTTVISESDKWTWDFGDGSTASDPNPHHLYNDTGTFYV